MRPRDVKGLYVSNEGKTNNALALLSETRNLQLKLSTLMTAQQDADVRRVTEEVQVALGKLNAFLYTRAYAEPLPNEAGTEQAAVGAQQNAVMEEALPSERTRKRRPSTQPLVSGAQPWKL